MNFLSDVFKLIGIVMLTDYQKFIARVMVFVFPFVYSCMLYYDFFLKFDLFSRVVLSISITLFLVLSSYFMCAVASQMLRCNLINNPLVPLLNPYIVIIDFVFKINSNCAMPFSYETFKVSCAKGWLFTLVASCFYFFLKEDDVSFMVSDKVSKDAKKHQTGESNPKQ